MAGGSITSSYASGSSARIRLWEGTPSSYMSGCSFMDSASFLHGGGSAYNISMTDATFRMYKTESSPAGSISGLSASGATGTVQAGTLTDLNLQ